MTKYHVNPETGGVNLCRAKKKCKFGVKSEHYETTTEARPGFEKSVLEKPTRASTSLH